MPGNTQNLMRSKITVLLAFCHLWPLFLAAQLGFPGPFLGKWEGPLLIYRNGQLIDSVSITFTAAATDQPGVWTWTTEYHAPERTLAKAYILKADPTAPTAFSIDEGDGIVLAAYWLGHKLLSVFETQGILLTSSYWLEGDQLIFEVTSGMTVSDDGPVTTYSINNLQIARLRRAD